MSKIILTFFMIKFHFLFQSGEKKTPLYEDILASLLSLYTELFILSERSVYRTKHKNSDDI